MTQRLPGRTSKVNWTARPVRVFLAGQVQRKLMWKPDRSARLLTPKWCLGNAPAEVLVERCVLLRADDQGERGPQLESGECGRIGQGGAGVA